MLISELGEEGLIDELRALFSDASEDIIVGIGDDAAVTRAPTADNQVWTTDILVEGIHFQTGWQDPESLGRKCLLVNISDIAAMGARPRFGLVSIAAPPTSDAGFIIALCRGIVDTAGRLGISILGGDSTSSSSGLIVNVALAGTAAGRTLTRSGASPGDIIAVTGELGAAAAGLRLHELGAAGEYPELAAAFMTPPLRIESAAAAVEAGATAMTDISDGIGADLRHICRSSGTGARIEEELLPVGARLRQACGSHGWDPMELVLDGGEDYELLMTFPPEEKESALAHVAAAEGVPVTAIGRITAPGEGIILQGGAGDVSEVDRRGYEHFRD